MNLSEFSKLKVGDKVENTALGGATSVGIIVKTEHDGVRVEWSGGGPSFFYSVMSTAWFQWSKVDDAPAT